MRHSIFSIVFFVFCSISSLFAGQISWNNVNGGNWNDPANWTPNAVPSASDTAYVTLDGSYTITVDANVNIERLELGASSGTQTLSSDDFIIDVASEAVINTNGILDLSRTTLNGNVNVTNYGTIILTRDNTLNVDIDNYGTIDVQRNNNSMTGQLTSQSGSLLDINVVTTRQAQITFDNGFVNNGQIEMSSSYASNSYHSYLTVTNGTLTNAAGGSITVLGGYGQRYLNGQLDNQGLLDVDYTLHLQGAAATHVNTGTIDIASGRALIVESTSFAYNGGTVNGPGRIDFDASTATFNVAVLPDVLMTFMDSELAAPATLTSNGTLRLYAGNTISASIDNYGTIDVQRNNNSMTGQLTTQAGSLLDVNVVTTRQAQITFDNGFVNNGQIEMSSSYASNSYHSYLTVTNGTLTNAAGGSITVLGGYGQRYLNGQLDNQGLLDVDYTLHLQGAAATHVNTGTIDIASGRALIVESTSFAYNGGTVNGPGRIDFDASTATFNVAVLPDVLMTFMDSELAAPATLTSNGTLRLYAGNTISASIDNYGTIDVQRNNNSMTGQLTTQAGSLLDVNVVTTRQAQITFDNGFVNNGQIEMSSSYASNSYHSYLTVNSGTLSNAGGGSITVLGGYGQRYLNGELDNQGLLNIDYTLRLQGSVATHSNTGTIDIASGQALSVENTSWQFDGGSVIGDGRIDFDASTATFNVAVLPDVLMTFMDSELAAAATLTNNGTVRLYAGNTISADIDNYGTIDVQRNNNSMTGQLTTQSGSLLDINVVTTRQAQITFDNGFVNNGQIEMSSGYASNSYHSYLTVTNGTLTNAAGGSITVLGGYGQRYLNGELDNQGLLDVDYTLHLQGAAATHVNTGTIDIASGRALIVESTSFAYNGGTVSGPGRIDFDASTATFNVAVLPDVLMTFMDSELAAPATLTSNGTVRLYAGNTISADIDNYGTIDVQRNNNSMTGQLTTQSGSLLDINVVTTRQAQITFDNGFVNNGQIEMSSGYASNSYHSYLTVTNGTLTNASGGSITVLGGYGQRYLNGELDNQGLLDVDYTLHLQGAAATHVNTGTIDIASGRALIVESTSFAYNGGTVNGPGRIDFDASTATFNVAVLPDVLMTFMDSELAAPATLTSNGTVRLYAGNTISADIDNYGTIDVQRNNNSMTGQLTTQSGSLLDINVVTTRQAQITFDNGFVNNGQIEMSSSYASHSYSTYLTVNSGLLTNASGGSITSLGGYGNRFLNASTDNQGAINVDYTLHLQGASNTHATSGTISIAANRVLILDDSNFSYDGGSISGEGRIDFSSTVATFNQPVLPEIEMTFSGSELASTQQLTNQDTLVLYENNTISAALDNADLIRVHRQSNSMTGAFTTQAGSALEIAVNTSRQAQITFDNGFTNNGQIEMSSGYASHSYSTYLSVTNGTLLNATNGVMISDGSYGYRYINADFENAGQLTMNFRTTFQGSVMRNLASGTIETHNGNNLTVSNAVFENEGNLYPGKIDDKGILNLSGNFLQPTSGAFTVDIEGLTAGSDFDQLNISANADLDGTLNINLLNGYQPAFGDSFQVLYYGTRTDTFETITGREIGNGLYLNPKYFSDHLTLVAGNPPATPVYEITATAGANGSISPSGIIEVDQGQNQTFAITPNSGYQVDDVLVDAASVGAVTSYTFNNVTADHTIEASFAVQTYTITATAGPNGSISPSGNVSVTGGTDQTFTITPATGYHVLDVLVDGSSVGPVTSYVFSSVIANHTIEASFELNTYTISAAAGANGSITPDGNVAVTHGDDQSFSITPNSNYEINDVVVDGSSVGAVSNYEFTNVTTNHSISASFSAITHTITTSTNPGGTVSPLGQNTVNQGSDFTVTIGANPGYSIDDVLVDGVSVGAVAQYTFSNVTTSHTLSATFSQNSYTITSSAGANGSIDPLGSITVLGGESQTFDITPDAGYHVDDVLVDGVSVGPATQYTFNTVDDDHTISASFALNTYSINAVAVANGSISPSGTVTVNEGDDQTFNISADVDYNIGDVFVDGVSQGAISSYAFTNVTQNHTISANFTPQNFDYSGLVTGVTVNIRGTWFVSENIGYVVGDGGLVLYTDDGGQSWTDYSVASGDDLYSVTVVNDTVWVTGANGHICYSIDGGLSWNYASPGGNTTFHAITFSGGFGWACGSDGLIYYWNGTSWVQQLNISGVTFHSIWAGDNVAYAVGTGGVIYNWNGSTWLQLSVSINVDLYGVYFLNSSFGYAVGANGTIYRTNDGGANWVALNSGVSVIIRNIIIGDANNAWAVGDGGLLLQTNDGGNTWEVIDLGINANFYGITLSGLQGYFVGGGGVAYRFESSALQGTPVFSVNPASIDFANTAVGYSNTRSLNVTNNGDGILEISAVQSGNSAFNVSPATASIAPSGNAVFNVTFSPAAGGSYSTDIEFSHNAAGSPCVVPVNGTGVETDLTFTAVNIGTTEFLHATVWLNAQIGYVAGANGTLYFTRDGGASWAQSVLGTGETIHAIRIIGNRLWIVGSNGLVCYSDDEGVSWVAVNVSTSATFYDITFINPFYGFAVGSSGVIYHWDGTSWTAQSTSVSVDFHSVYAVGSTAYAVGANGVICRWNGSAWVQQNTATTLDFNAVVFWDHDYGFAVGNDGLLCRTSDGGATWVGLSSGVSLDITAIRLFSRDRAWATCANGIVLETSDGGNTWVQISLGIGGRLAGIDFRGCLGFIVGQDGLAYSFNTPACGSLATGYTRLYPGSRQHLYGVSFIDAQNGCIAGWGGNVFITSDGGSNWTPSQTGTTTNLTGIRLVGNNTAFITGYDGLICASYDNGVSWVPFTLNTTAHFFDSYFLSASFGYAVGSNGTICVYDGTSWSAQPTNTSVTFYGVFAIGSTAYAVGANGTICRWNGTAWVPQTSNTNIDFYGVAFVNEKFGFAVGADGTLCRTRDGGKTWEPRPSGTDLDLYGCKVVSGKVAYCVGEDGIVLETTDCGETWHEVSPDIDVDLSGIDIPLADGFSVGELGEALRFENSVLSDVPVFSLASFSSTFDSVAVNDVFTQNVTVYNNGTGVLQLDDLYIDADSYTVSPENATLQPGDSLVVSLNFEPKYSGRIVSHVAFSHNSSCYLDSLKVEGCGYEAPGKIAGTVSVNGQGLAGVIVKLLDQQGLPIGDVADKETDAQGQYLFEEVVPDSYRVMIVEPMGYGVDLNPKETVLESGGCNIVDFALTELVVSNEARSKGYWKHQFDVYEKGKGKAQENENDLYLYIDEIHEHYTVHYDFFNGFTTFAQWQDVLTLKKNPSMRERALAQLAAFVMNLSSEKIGQHMVATEDERTVGDVLTHVSNLLEDSDTSNDEMAKDLAEDINLQRSIGAGIVPAGDILYKNGKFVQWGFGVPDKLALYPNYPNPFNPTTTIRYDLPQSAHVSLVIYNILGQKVATLVDGPQRAGKNRVVFDARSLSSGIYVYVFRSGGFTQIKRMLLLK